MPVTYQGKILFQTDAGTSFNRGMSLSLDDDAASGVDMTEIIHFTAPVGTSYEQVFDFDTVADFATHNTGTTKLLIFNRSSTQTMTLKFVCATKNGYAEVPPGAWFTYDNELYIDSETCTAIEAKFASSEDEIEIWGYTLTAES